MKIAFRQGIVSSYSSGLTPLFLAPSATPGFIDLVVSPEPTVVAFAHGGSDYLQVFNTDVVQAWGPIINGQSAYLYWEIDQLTAAVSFKMTQFPMLTGLEAPVAPAVDQHWFDLSTTTMKYWTGTKWLPKIAVFAGSFPGGVVNLPAGAMGYGSQVGLNTPSDPGFIYLTALLKPIYTNPATFEFLTSTTNARIKTTSGTSGVLATPPNAFIPVRASENIPAFSLVYFSGADTVGLASSNPALPSPKIPIGIVQVDLSTNEMGNVTQTGEIQWDMWDWSAHIGKPLYCTSTGQLTPVRPNGLLAYRVAFVKNRNTILFNVDAETQPQIYTASPTTVIVDGVTPLASTYTDTLAGERIWSITIPPATNLAGGYATPAQITQLNDHETRLDDVELALPTKAPLVHTHTIADVDTLQTELDNLNTALGLKADKVSGATSGHFAGLNGAGNLTDSGFNAASFALAVHTHLISDVSNLQTVLNSKSDVGHTHGIPEVTGLQSALDGKADVVHTHLIADVTGLVLALNDKSDVGHGHAIADVALLQDALDDKSDVGHGHAIADVALLQSTLDGKAPLVHTHDIVDVTGLQSALNAKEPLLGAGNVTDYYRGDKTWQDLDTAVNARSITVFNDVNTSGAVAGQVLKFNGTDWVPAVDDAGTGTVTSVDISGGDGIGVAGGPVTSSGTFILTLGNLTPDSVAAVGTVTGSNLSGTNTGDQTITLVGDASGTGTSSISVSIPTFTGTFKGLVPVSAGGTSNFLRADGAWAKPTVAPLYEEYTAVGAETVVNTTIPLAAKDTRAYIQVFVNGLLQMEGLGMDVTGQFELTFTNPLGAGWHLAIFSYV